MHAEREHYPVVCRLDQSERVLLWFSDDSDGLVVNDRGRVISFDDLSDAVGYAQDHGLALVNEPPHVYDIDQLHTWISETNRPVDCRALLDCWNLFVDFAASVEQGGEFRRQDQAASSIYEKLFFGNNLPAVTPPNCTYEPVWSDAELAQIAALMSAGILLFRVATVDAA
jgi:hypothetical protein